MKILGIFDKIKKFLNKSDTLDNTVEETTTDRITFPVDEEDKVIIALAAAALAGKDKPNSKFHISKIVRIK